MATDLQIDVASGLDVTGPLVAEVTTEIARGPWNRLRQWWKRQTSDRPEDDLVFSGEGGGRPPLRMVAPLVSPVLLVPAVLLVREPENSVALIILLIGLAAVAFGLVMARLERSLDNAFWLHLVSMAFFAGLISGLLYFVVAVEHPRAHVHWVIFFLYFLLIGAAGLASDPRLAVASGSFAMIGYLACLMAILAAADAGNPMAVRLAPEFEWVASAAKVAILGGTTLTATASAQRGLALRRSSVHDALTGLLNRRAFDECLARQASRAQARGRPLSVAMVDIDHFKALNDVHGHRAGDAVLSWVASQLRRSVRGTDLVARYGGEEFVVAFIDSDHEFLDERLETWRNGLAQSTLRVRGSDREIHVTVSIGVARLPADAPTAEEVLARADARLYEAKGSGRNRVVG